MRITTRAHRYLFPLLGLLLLAYTCIRAALLSLTYDEAYSYLYYILDTYPRIADFSHFTSNNHVLSNLLAKFFSSFLPWTDFAIRLPDLIGHLLYLIFTTRLLKLAIPHYGFRLGAWLFINLNPFLLDFFVVCRGYGLSFGLWMCSLFYLLRLLRQPLPWLWNYSMFMLAGGLALTANFTLLFMYGISLAVSGGYALWQFLKRPELRYRIRLAFNVLLPSLIIGLPLVRYSLGIITRLKDANELYFGGTEGFWQDTVGSLVSATLYGQSYAEAIKLLLMSGVFVLLVLHIPAIVVLFRSGARFTHPWLFILLPLLSAMLLLSVGLHLVAHYWQGALFAIERAALPYLIVFGMSSMLALYSLWLHWRAVSVLAAALAGAAVLHFFVSLNFTHTDTWKENADIRTALLDLRQDAAGRKDAVRLQCWWEACQVAGYYRRQEHSSWLRKPEAQDPNAAADYYFYPKDQLDMLDHIQADTVKHYALSNYYLLKNRQPGSRRPVLQRRSIPDTIQSLKPWLRREPAFRGLQSVYQEPQGPMVSLIIPADSLGSDTTQYLIAEAWVYPLSRKSNARIFITFNDSSANGKGWHTFHLYQQKFIPRQWQLFRFSLFVPQNRRPGDMIHVDLLPGEPGSDAIYAGDLKVRVEE